MNKKAIFLDRDGTLIVEKNYLSNPNEVCLERGAVPALRLLRQQGYLLIVITNQSGISRGYFAIEDAVAVNNRVDELLSQEGVGIDGWYICPHTEADNCDCRKPSDKLPRQAAEDFGLDLKKCWVVGDKRSDVLMAPRIGGRGILVTTGHGGADADWAKYNGYPVFDTLEGAAAFIRQGAASEAG